MDTPEDAIQDRVAILLSKKMPFKGQGFTLSTDEKSSMVILNPINNECIDYWSLPRGNKPSKEVKWQFPREAAEPITFNVGTGDRINIRDVNNKIWEVARISDKNMGVNGILVTEIKPDEDKLY